MRAGDRALVSLHQAWGDKFARIWDAVADFKVTAALAAFALVYFGAVGCAWASSGRIVDGPCTHVGIRPTDLSMVDDEAPEAHGVSVRVTTDWPACTRGPGARSR